MSDLVYAVERNHWRWYGPKLDRLTRLPGRVRLHTFDDADAADADRAAREADVRGRVNPFRCGTALGALTTFDAGRLRDWLLDADLEPPASMAVKDLEAWWDAASFTELQRARVWEGLDRVRFHEVIRRPRRPAVYVVVEVNWTYNDQGYDADQEGGKPFRAFRSREKAEQECDSSNDLSRDHWGEQLDEDDETLDDAGRRVAAFGLAAPAELPAGTPVERAAFWEVIEVEVEG
ncbi:MAG: hypothetical protein ACRC33_03240 [Gemmataceae bacterium]